MPRFRSRRRFAAVILTVCAVTGTADAGEFVWSPPPGSDRQWMNPAAWLSESGGTPGISDTVHFAQLPQPAESSIVLADPDPSQSPPANSILSVGQIVADGFYSYTEEGDPLTDWRIELARFTPDPNHPGAYLATPFVLDVGESTGIVRIGHFQEPDEIGGPATAIPGGLIITGQSVIEHTAHSASVGFRGTLDIRHGRLTLSEINFADNDPLSIISGVVDSRDDLSYIPQRLPTAELIVDHSHFDSAKNVGLLIGTVGKATATFRNGTIVANLKELRVGGNSQTNIGSHEVSLLSLTDSQVTVGDGYGGGVYIGDLAAFDLIDTYNGRMTLTRSSLGASLVRDAAGQVVGVEPLDVHVGHRGSGQLLANDASSINARRVFVGGQPFSFGEMRLTSSSLSVTHPEGPETPDHAGWLSIGGRGLGFAVIAGSAAAPSLLSARTLTLGENQNAYGDLYVDRDTSLTLADSAAIGIGGQGRLTITGRFDSHDLVEQRNLYATATADIGMRPGAISSDPGRNYRVTVGKIFASAGYLVVGEGGRLNVTDQPLSGTDDVDELGVELWRSTDHRMVIGDDGLGWLTVHADAQVRTEKLLVGMAPLGVGHVVLDKTFLNASAAEPGYAVPGTMRISRSASIGVDGVGTLDVRGPYVPRVDLNQPEILDDFLDYGLLTASMVVGDNAGSSGAVHVFNSGQIRITGTEPGERDLVIAREGVGYLDIGDSIEVTGPEPTYVRGGTGGTVSVVGDGVIQIGGADASVHSAAKGTVTIFVNGLLEGGQLTIGGPLSSDDNLTTRMSRTVLVEVPGGGTEWRTFPGGTVRVERVQLQGASTLAIESNPIVVPANERRDGGFYVAQDIDVLGGTLRLGMVSRSSTGTVFGQVDLLGGKLKGGGAIVGDLNVEGGTIGARITGAERFTEFDGFDVSGIATFSSGAIEVEAGDYVGLIGQQFDILRFASGSRTPAFAVVNPLASQAGTQWVWYLDADSLTLAVAGATGDANLDGAVNFDDLLTLAQNYGDSGSESWITGDFNGDLAVSFDDLLVMAQNYGVSLLGTSDEIHAAFASDWARAQAIVPEPTAALLLASGLLVGRRRPGSGLRC